MGRLVAAGLALVRPVLGRLSGGRLALVGAVAVLVMVVAHSVVWIEPGAADEPVVHGRVVPEAARSHLDRVLIVPQVTGNAQQPANRQVYATAVVGPYIVVGGDFLDIERADGTVVRQPYLAAFELESGRFVEGFRPELDREVRVLHAGVEPDTVLVGGRFNRVTGPDGVVRERRKLAKLRLPDGTVDPDWVVPGLDGQVSAMDVHGQRLFVGGDFTQVADTDIGHLVEVDASTGHLNRAFEMSWEGTRTRTILAAEVSPDGSRLVVGHRATAINGQPRRGTAVFSIVDPAAPVLTEHQMGKGLALWKHHDKIQDAAVSPDGRHIALVGGTAGPADWVHLIPTDEAPGQAGWELYLRDSAFSVAVSDVAVYVAGHFCRIANGPRASGDGEPKLGLDDCNGSRDYDEGRWRTQMAALDLADGTPLDWNPANNARVGARRLEVVDRGLLMGMDGRFAGGRETGALAFFDFGPGRGDRAEPTAEVGGLAGEGGEAVLVGSATDDRAVSAVQVSVRRVADDTYLQPDGGFAGVAATRWVDPVEVGEGRWSWELRAPLLPGVYLIGARAVDGVGKRSGWSQLRVTVGEPDQRGLALIGWSVRWQAGPVFDTDRWPGAIAWLSGRVMAP